ncbi:MAG: protein kinase [Polyangiaceae bacterium]
MKNPFFESTPADGVAVRVDERIPVAIPSNLPIEVVRAEKIPSPSHLVVKKAIGHGGMGHVHPATDRNLLRDVAMKRLNKEYSGTTYFKDAFIAEAQINGQLEHPNIVPVHELAIDANGVPYFTMKLVQGQSFDKWLSLRAPGTVERIEGGIEILLKICDAIAYAHYRGVVHRDLKPENVMVGDFGQVYVMDWGLSKLIHSEPASGNRAMMNAPGPVGTPGYMSPEQARGNPADIDERSDVFGVGAMLFDVLSGRPPFGTGPTEAVLKRTAAGEVLSIDEACAHVGVSRRIRAVAERATMADPDKRYPSIMELKEAMRGFLHGGLHLPRRVYAAGDLIVREGEKGDAAYMIVAGRCRAFRTVNGVEETLSIMEPGDAFGEMALILYEPRSASVVAVDNVTLLVLDQATMNEGLGLSGWTGALVRALAQRFRDLEGVVRNSGIRRSHHPADER